MARSPRAVGRRPGDRSPRPQSGRDARLLAADGRNRSQGVRVLAAARSLPVRPRPGAPAPGRGGLSERLRRRRALGGAAVLLARGNDHRLSASGRDPREAPDDGARCLLLGLARQEAPRPQLRRQRGPRQHGHAPGELRRGRRALHQRRLSRHR